MQQIQIMDPTQQGRRPVPPKGWLGSPVHQAYLFGMRGNLLVFAGMLTGVIGGGLIESTVAVIAAFILFAAGFVLSVYEGR